MSAALMVEGCQFRKTFRYSAVIAGRSGGIEYLGASTSVTQPVLKVKLQQGERFAPAGSAVGESLPTAGGVLVAAFFQAHDGAIGGGLDIDFDGGGVGVIVGMPLENEASIRGWPPAPGRRLHR